MAELLSVFRGTMVAVEVEGVTLVVDERINYVTVDDNGSVRGWTDHPYYDEEYGDWECMGGEETLLATITLPDHPEKLYEVYQ